MASHQHYYIRPTPCSGGGAWSALACTSRGPPSSNLSTPPHVPIPDDDGNALLDAQPAPNTAVGTQAEGSIPLARSHVLLDMVLRPTPTIITMACPARTAEDSCATTAETPPGGYVVNSGNQAVREALWSIRAWLKYSQSHVSTVCGGP